MVNPWLGLVQSRKFWVLVLDGVVTLITFFVGKYANWAAEDVGIVIGVIQPVFLFMIGGIAFEDGMEKRAGISWEVVDEDEE